MEAPASPLESIPSSASLASGSCSECSRRKQEIVSLKARLAAVEESYTDFSETSKELERVLQEELHRNEEEIAYLRKANSALSVSELSLQSKLRSITMENEVEMDRLRALLSQTSEKEKALHQKLRESETVVDELQNKERQHTASIQRLSQKLEEVQEENLFLNTQLSDEKKRSMELGQQCQRLRDTLRDLQQDITHRRSSTSSSCAGAIPTTTGGPPVSGSARNLASVPSSTSIPSPTAEGTSSCCRTSSSSCPNEPIAATAALTPPPSLAPILIPSLSTGPTAPSPTHPAVTEKDTSSPSTVPSTTSPTPNVGKDHTNPTHLTITSATPQLSSTAPAGSSSNNLLSLSMSSTTSSAVQPCASSASLRFGAAGANASATSQSGCGPTTGATTSAVPPGFVTETSEVIAYSDLAKFEDASALLKGLMVSAQKVAVRLASCRGTCDELLSGPAPAAISTPPPPRK